MSVCEVCWAEASRRQSLGDPRPVVEIYNDILSEFGIPDNDFLLRPHAPAETPVPEEDE